MVEKEKPIPIRIRIISEIKAMLKRTAIRGKGIYVEKLVAQYMEKEGLSRRLILECVDSVYHSGFATYNKKEKILKKK